MTRDERLWLWLNYGTEHNVKAFHRIKDSFDSIEEAYECAKKGDKVAFSATTDGIYARLKEAADERFMDRYTLWLERHKVGVATLISDDYPELLKEIPDPPTVLFYLGSLKRETELPVAIVGSRKCTEYGRDMARLFARQLVEGGATVVTGLAGGIDTHAALGAMDDNVRHDTVIGVLGCGIDVVYPSSSKLIYEGVVENGAIVTEFLPKTQPLPQNFPIRNRIMSGLSLGVLVVEAGERSGASITAGCALEQGRDVYAIPGRITDPMSVTTNRMIQRGEAKPVYAVSDILCEYLDNVGDMPYNATAKQVRFTELGEMEQKVYLCLLEGEKNVDELTDKLECKASELNSTLTTMEFSGIIKQLAGRLFACDTIKTNVIMDE